MKKIAALSFNDIRNIVRETILMYIILLPIVFAVASRYLVPEAAIWLKPYFDLKPYYSLIAGIFILFCPLLVGMVTGFLLLDERDENTLIAMMITPMPRSGYIVYRVFVGVVLSLIYGVILLPLINLVKIPLFYSIPAVVVAAMEAPLYALFLSVFAGNKVEGFALSKIGSLLIMVPLVIFLVPSKWQLLAGVFPSYWPVKALVTAYQGETGYWLYVCGGVLIHSVYLYLLMKKFNKKIG